jgi:hypothetical protein
VGSCLSNQVWRMRYGELLAILASETIVGTTRWRFLSGLMRFV